LGGVIAVDAGISVGAESVLEYELRLVLMLGVGGVGDAFDTEIGAGIGAAVDVEGEGAGAVIGAGTVVRQRFEVGSIAGGYWSSRCSWCCFSGSGACVASRVVAAGVVDRMAAGSCVRTRLDVGLGVGVSPETGHALALSGGDWLS
jgi:hypothetical protein